MTVIPHIIHAKTLGDAWRQCVDKLIADGDRFNLVVHISAPSTINDEQLRQYNPRRIDSSVMSIFDVANTIFPKQSGKWELGIDQFSDYYKDVYDRLKRRSPPGWGFYFQRLISFGSTRSNQLASIVAGLGDWGRRHHGAFVLHLSSIETDKPRPQGGPCWQFAEFMADGDKLNLLVTYRSHDYFLKALGNFVGLSRLLTFVCKKTDHLVGTLTCISTYAYLNKHKTKTERLLAL